VSDLEFELRVARGLRAPVATDPAARRAIMERIRQVPAAQRPRRALASYGRGVRRSLIGLAFAAGIGSITALPALAPSTVSVHSAGVVTSVVIGDTVVNRLRDTLRLVRLMFDDSTAHQVAVAGDFNGWDERSTRLRRDEHTGRWTATLALRDGDHRYAIVADNLRWPGRLHVARTTN
jgi:hypothetical protein